MRSSSGGLLGAGAHIHGPHAPSTAAVVVAAASAVVVVVVVIYVVGIWDFFVQL